MTPDNQPDNKQTGKPTAHKSAFITGGSKGIGYAAAQALAGEGYSVTITSRNEAEVLAAAQQLGAQVRGAVCDVRDYAALEKAVQEHVATFGGLDVLFVNAGVGHFAPIQDLSLEAWQSVIDTNLTGAFYTIKAALEALKNSKGYIITLSSLAGKNPFAGASAYNASKFGLNGLSEAMMLDLRPLGIKVTQIMPGSVATHFGGHTPSAEDAWKIQPEDIAQIIKDLLKMPQRTLPSKIEVRPAQPKSK